MRAAERAQADRITLEAKVREDLATLEQPE
jgi:hypothetical protein